MKGEVVYLYAFDVANEIATARVREILSQKPFPFEIRMDRALPKDVPLYRPIAIAPRAPGALLRGQPVRLLVRVYEVGVVSIMMRVDIAPGAIGDLAPFHNAALDDGRTLDTVAQELCAEVCASLREFMVSASPQLPPPEAYTAFCLTDLDGATDTAQWLAAHRRAVAGLLSETPPERLSEGQMAETTRIQRSFEKTDLVVIDWDAALIVDLAGTVDDELYALELANLQLEELRVMDQRLDHYLEGAYRDLERKRLPLFGAPTALLRRLRHFRMDVTRLTDEITHITKFVGDWYLARVYLGARERFYLDQWRESVEHRLGQLDKLYSLVQSDITDRRMLILEVLIVIFFAVDLAWLFAGGH